MTKTERQNIGISKYLKAKAIGTLHYVMRFGKTRVGCFIAKRFLDKYPDSHIIILVPSLAIKKEWEAEITNHISSNYDIITVGSVKHNLNYNCGLLIVDEIHKFTSEARQKLLDNSIIHYTYNLGLTGTYPFGNKVIEQYFPIVDTITEYEAIQNKWISNFIEFNIPLELSEADKNRYIKYSSTMFEVLSTFKGLYNILVDSNNKPFFKDDLDLILSCHSGKNVKDVGYVKSYYIREAVSIKMGYQPELDLDNEHNKTIDKYWSPDAIKNRVTDFYIAMRKRNDIHNINDIKLKAVLLLCDKFKDKNKLIFSESTMFADMITTALNNRFDDNKCVSYHSDIKSKPLINFVTNKYFTYKNGNIKKFSRSKQLDYIKSLLQIGVYDTISTVKSLDEGFNAESIEIVITTSGTANPMQYSQRSARGKTVDKYNKNKITLIFNLYFNDFMFNVNGEYKEFKSRDKTKLYIRENYDVNSSNIKTVSLVDIIENY